MDAPNPVMSRLASSCLPICGQMPSLCTTTPTIRFLPAAWRDLRRAIVTSPVFRGSESIWRQPQRVRYAVVASRGVWRSLVARFVRDEEVVGSNPATPTLSKQFRALPFETDRALFAVYCRRGCTDRSANRAGKRSVFRFGHAGSGPFSACDMSVKSCFRCDDVGVFDGGVRYASNGDFRLAYRVLGDGDPTLVWVPGWISNVDMLDDEESMFTGFFEQLAEQT